MRLKEIILLLLLAHLFLIAGLSQDKNKKDEKPDFSGNWTYVGYYSPVENAYKTETEKSTLKLVIVNNGAELKITRSATNPDGKEISNETICYTDGRGETRLLDYPISTSFPDRASKPEKLKTKTKWDGNKLVSRGAATKIIKGQFLHVEVVEEWKFVNDGKILMYSGTQTVPSDEVAKIMVAMRGGDPRNPGAASPTKILTSEFRYLFERAAETTVKEQN